MAMTPKPTAAEALEEVLANLVAERDPPYYTHDEEMRQGLFRYYAGEFIRAHADTLRAALSPKAGEVEECCTALTNVALSKALPAWVREIATNAIRLLRVTQSTAVQRCRYCGVPDGDGHTGDCYLVLRATQSNGHSPDDALAPSNGNPFPSRPVESPAPSTPAQEGESTREQIDAGWVADLAYEDELKNAGYTHADRRERVRRILRAARLLRATQAQPLTDAQIVEIRDDHLPSQGEPFDCLAFARAVLRATQSNETKP